MHIYIRRFLLLISYTTFVIAAPIIILYAIGYRPQISSPIPRPVGVILADALPKRATISVNGTSYGTLPRSIPNIEPGLASVQVEKAGYIPWQKSLEIKPTQATDIRSLFLIPASPLKEKIVERVRLFAVSQNGLLIATVSTNNTLHITDEEGIATLPDQELVTRPTALTWSADGAYILVTFPKNTYQIFRVNGTTVTTVPAKELTGITRVHFSPTSTNTLYGLDKNKSIISYNTATAAKETIAQNVTMYEIANRTIYYQTFQNELIAYQIRSRDSRVITKDTGKTIKKITATGDGMLALLFGDGQLQIVRANGDNKIVSEMAHDMAWSPNGQLLLVQSSPTELNVFNIENERLFAIPLDELHFITRLSQPITNPQWFSDSLHIMYQTNDNVVFSEIDTRDHAIAFPLITSKILSPLTAADDSKSVLAIEQDETGTHLVKTWLVTEEDK